MQKACVISSSGVLLRRNLNPHDLEQSWRHAELDMQGVELGDVQPQHIKLDMLKASAACTRHQQQPARQATQHKAEHAPRQ
jgi:hypothetical protein